MSETTDNLGVFLCTGQNGRPCPSDFTRLAWTVRAALPEARVHRLPQLCLEQGQEALRRLVAEEELSRVLLAACPLAGEAPAWSRALVREGLPAGQVVTLDLCQKPTGARGACQLVPEAVRRLAQELARLAEPAPLPGSAPVAAEEEPSRRVLVLGHGLAALELSLGLAAEGFLPWLVTPGSRLAPPCPGEEMADPGASKKAAGLFRQLVEQGRAELTAGGSLISLAGSAGAFGALIRNRQGETLARPVGAAALALGPGRVPNLPPAELPDSPRVLALAQLARLVNSPGHLLKAAGTNSPRVGLALGLGRETGPGQTALGFSVARRLLALPGARVTLYTGNLKVAAPELEEARQELAGLGLWIMKFRGRRPRFRLAGEQIMATYHEEVLDQEMEEELDLLAVDQSPVADSAHHDLLSRLGLSPGPRGDGLPGGVIWGPTATCRGGVFSLARAGGPVDAAIRQDLVGATLGAMRELLQPRSQPPNPVRVLVDRRLCALCLTCVRACPQGAMTWSGGRRPRANPLVCTACGTCASLCPQDAIQLAGCEDLRYRRTTRAGLPPASLWGQPPAEPELLVLACANGPGRALAAARLAGQAWPAGARLVRAPCAGRVDPQMIWDAFLQGYDGVLLLACHPGACQSREGNTWSGGQLDHLARQLAEAGGDPRRLMRQGLAPSQVHEAQDAVVQAVERLRELGPSLWKMGGRVREFLAGFTIKVDQTYAIIP
ncbi:MAG: hydrogenase iron-sulfur subunit [Deltaproteobacteria bacterium]|nr:hydrogenase iron-sulfur subunit [Deltaproteobacteria bacterium]